MRSHPSALLRPVVRISLAAIVTLVAMATLASTAFASHSWSNYHWARTSSPFSPPLALGSNITSNWTSYVQTASNDWSADPYAAVYGNNPVRTALAAGGTSARKCRANTGRVEVCNASYGKNGWLGLASIWVSSSHITQGTVKLNDSYFNLAKYNTPIWRGVVACQEIGHTLGLDHQDESGANLHTCMDYANSPDSANTHPNAHDYEQLAIIYRHLDGSTTIGASSPTNSRAVSTRSPREGVYVITLADGGKRIIWVNWVDDGPHPAPPIGE